MPIILRGTGPAPAAPSPVAFSTIIEACLEEMSEGPYRVTGLATADGDADSLIDTTNLQETGAQANATRYVGKWVRLTISGIENIRKVKSYDPATGTLVPEASFSGAPGTGNAYEVHRLLEPDRLKQAICDALAELRYQDILPLTLVVDGDMEASGTSEWTATNATLTKDTTYVLFGRQSLGILATAANGMARTKTAIPVSPGEQLVVWAPVYGNEGQALMILWDATNGANIESARHDEKGWGLLCFTATVPKGCYSVNIYCYTKVNGATTYWDHVGVLKCNEKVYPSPSWLTKRQDFIKIVSFPYGSSLTSPNASNAYSLFHHGPQHEHVHETVFAHRGVVPLRLPLSESPSKPLFVVGKRRYPALSADTDETEADVAVVKTGALAFAYRRLGNDYAATARKWTDNFNDLRRSDEPPVTVRQSSCWRNR